MWKRVSVVASLSADDNLKIVLGLVYAGINLIGSYFSKKAHIVKGERTSYAVLYAVLAIFSGQYLVVSVIYLEPLDKKHTVVLQLIRYPIRVYGINYFGRILYETMYGCRCDK